MLERLLKMDKKVAIIRCGSLGASLVYKFCIDKIKIFLYNTFNLSNSRFYCRSDDLLVMRSKKVRFFLAFFFADSVDVLEFSQFIVYL